MSQFENGIIAQNQRLQGLVQELTLKLRQANEHLADAREAASLDREELRVVQNHEADLVYNATSDKAALKALREQIRAMRDAAVTTEDGNQAGPLKQRIIQISRAR